MSLGSRNPETRSLPIALLVGSILTIIWTLLRFFSQRTVYDQVSQQVVVHQWLHGLVSPAHMGQTAYVLKMVLLYIPLDLLPGSPRLKLILATIVINLITFLLVAIVLKKILNLFNIHGVNLGNSLVWFAGIAGSVFWISFANSRNVEVVGGSFLLYLSLHFLQNPSKQKALWLTLFAGLLFFADPLQLYMSALPMVLYATVLSLRRHYTWRLTIYLMLIFLVGLGLSKVLFGFAHHFLLLSFNGTGGFTLPDLSWGWILASLLGTVTSTTTLFAGAADAGKIRELVNLAIVLLGAVIFLYSGWRQWLPKNFVAFILSILVIDELVYIASGQAAQVGTSRYLIMIAPIAVLVLAAAKLPNRLATYMQVAFVTVAVINLCTLSAVLYTNWDTSFPKDAHIESIYRYTEIHPTQQIYTSIDSAMPLLYYHNLPAQTTLPLGCSDGSLVRTYYSMDNSFKQAAKQPQKIAAVVLDGTSIVNTPSVCTENSLASRIGQPIGHETIDDGSVVLLYRQADLQIR